MPERIANANDNAFPVKIAVTIPTTAAEPKPNTNNNTYFSNTICFLEHGNVISQALVCSCCSNAKAEQGSNVKKIGIKVEKLKKNEMSS